MWGERSAYIYSEIIIKDEKRNRVKRNIPIIVNEFLTIWYFPFTDDKRVLLTNSVEWVDKYLAAFLKDKYDEEHELTAQRCCLEYNWTWDERCH